MSNSKNSVYVDHPHNNWESFLENMSGDKTGYNTIEKMSNSDVGGGGGSESDSSIFNVSAEIISEGILRLNKTWQEIYDAVVNGKFVVVTSTYENPAGQVLGTDFVQTIYPFTVSTASGEFEAETADDYPQIDDGK